MAAGPPVEPGATRLMLFRRRPPKLVNLALQGGGAHGAFTWGVLDRLIEDDRLAFDGISGTSAGAMNAVAFAAGYEQGGRPGAREALQKFWRAVSRDGRMNPIQRSLVDRFLGNWSLDHNPAFLAFDVASRFLSPYDFNPFNINPLREILEREIDFEAVRAGKKLKLFISATNVRTGKSRIFRSEEITSDAVMASACLPFLFHAVEIDGTPYWDGGYVGNPPLFPLFRTTRTNDVILVQTNPTIREGTPQTAREILNRINEITFNASLLSEFRAIGFVRRLIGGGLLRGWNGKRGQRDLLLHRIAADEELGALTSSSKFNTEWPFFLHLRDIGRSAAERFLADHYATIGSRSSLDFRRDLA
jgi:NTE family protein